MLRDPVHGCPPGVLQLSSVATDGALQAHTLDHSDDHDHGGVVGMERSEGIYNKLAVQHAFSSVEHEAKDGDEWGDHLGLKGAPVRSVKRRASDSPDDVDFMSLCSNTLIAPGKDKDGEPPPRKMMPATAAAGAGASSGVGRGAGGGKGARRRGSLGAEGSAAAAGDGKKSESTTKTVKCLSAAEKVLTEGEMMLKMMRSGTAALSVSPASAESLLKKIDKSLTNSALCLVVPGGSADLIDWKPAEIRSKLLDVQAKLQQLLPVMQGLHAKTNSAEAHPSFLHHALEQALSAGYDAPQGLRHLVFKREIDYRVDVGSNTLDFADLVPLLSTPTSAQPFSSPCLDIRKLGDTTEEQASFIVGGLIVLMRALLPKDSPVPYWLIGTAYAESILKVDKILKAEVADSMNNFNLMCKLCNNADGLDLKLCEEAFEKDFAFQIVNSIRAGLSCSAILDLYVLLWFAMHHPPPHDDQRHHSLVERPQEQRHIVFA